VEIDLVAQAVIHFFSNLNAQAVINLFSSLNRAVCLAVVPPERLLVSA
jgi:hypothetical protein